MIVIDLGKARKTASDKLGIEIDDDVAKRVLEYAARKCAINKLSIEYLPVLYENELKDFYTRAVINLIGAAEYV